MNELRVLATDINIEELLTQANNAYKDADKEDDLEGWVNKQSRLSTLNLKRLKANVQPVQRMLVKVSMPLSTCCAHVVNVLLIFALL